jgi:DNA-binding MarR family transcriptional regulator
MSDGASNQPFGVERAEESPGLLLWQVTNAWQRIMRATLVPFDLTHVQFVLLASTAWLTRTGGEITQIEIAAHARTDPMMTSQVLRALETKGFLTRRPHSVDRRAMRVDLTEAGHELVGQTVPAVEGADADFFRALGPDQPAMIAMLQQLAERD